MRACVCVCACVRACVHVHVCVCGGKGVLKIKVGETPWLNDNLRSSVLSELALESQSIIHTRNVATIQRSVCKTLVTTNNYWLTKTCS